MSASELVKSRPPRASASVTTPSQYRPIAPVTPIPVVEPPPKAKRGRKPNPGSKSAREALRKESHSRIEKRRREKINETLTALRELIAEGETNSRQQHSPPPGPEREFKLELLERTVIFVRGLLDKTRRLEQELNDLRGPVARGDEVDAESEPPRKRKKIATPSSSPNPGPSYEREPAVDDIELDESSGLSSPEPETTPPSPAPHLAGTLHSHLLFLAGACNLHGPTGASVPESQMETLDLPSPEVSLSRNPTYESRLKAGKLPGELDSSSEDTDTAAAALLLQFSSKTPMKALDEIKSLPYCLIDIGINNDDMEHLGTQIQLLA
ncbi:helix loop helix DNA-binding domain protein [Rhizoctonia solani]|uniref:Helix loop helix DNA-binding domain protein n=1 Tax=Rhizoctonia solani TaxID=456999 RepID=A0A8H8P8T7_9AGAM|nr:helix loop helix DNA-binding domain protein [Rhizoctonia solani]QRW25926.1 helix loop helix DNA-binding domain protein [Rhizoctonia solani]